MEMYEVGGCVRDEILGVKSKDIDYTVVLSEGDFVNKNLTVVARDPFVVMRDELHSGLVGSLS